MTADIRRAALDYCWYLDSAGGMPVAAIAGAWGVPEDDVRAGLERAGAAEAEAERSFAAAGRLDPDAPRVLPIFPAGPLEPGSACPHRGPLPPRSRLYCTVCHAYGGDPPDPAA